MSSLRKIGISCDSLRELQVGDTVELPRRTYLVTGIASGGMGTVIFGQLDSARQNASVSILPNPIALKFSCDPANYVASELSKWSLLQHENINPLSEILSSKSDGLVAASRQLSGSVRSLLSGAKRVSERTAYNIIRSSAEALAYAFKEHKVLHLDVKPENILYVNSGNSLEQFDFALTDWGIASEKSVSSTITSQVSPQQTNNNAGTLPYMAPERFVRGTASSVASDIFSLGIVWLELLTGSLPLLRDIPVSVQLQSGVYFECAERLMEAENLSKGTSSIIRKAIHPDRSIRLADWERFIHMIQPGFLRRLFS